MSRTIIAATLCLLVAACGSDAPANAAVNKTFSYGAPVPASSAQLALMQAPLGDALAFQGTQNVDAAESFTDVSQFTDLLLGSAGTSLALGGTAPRTALTIVRQPPASYLTTDLAGLDDPACVKQTTGTVTFDGCTVTITDPTSPAKIAIHGFVSGSSGGALSWDLTIAMTITFSEGNLSATLHRSGDLTISPGNVDGQLLSEISATASASGRSESLTVTEAVDLMKLTYQTTPTSCITSGTLQARRVWTKRPSSSGVDTSDRAAQITWTGCGIGTISFST